MTPGTQCDAGLWKGRADFLSSEEERVLSELRERVRGIRAGGASADVRSLVAGLESAGAWVEGEEANGLRFRMGDTCFSLRSAPDATLEVAFHFKNA